MATEQAYEKQREIALDMVKKSGGDYEHALRFAEYALKQRREMMNKIAHLYSLDRENDELIFAHDQSKRVFEETERELFALKAWWERDGKTATDLEVDLADAVIESERNLKRKRKVLDQVELILKCSEIQFWEGQVIHRQRKKTLQNWARIAKEMRDDVALTATELELARKRVKKTIDE
jgi:hypothetical protein